MNGCRFCQLDENGDCTCVVLECRDTGEQIKLFFAEARVTVTIDHENPTRMFYPIYYCPMCGSKIRGEGGVDMRSLEEIRMDRRILVVQSGIDGGHGWMFLDRKKPNKMASVIWSNGGGWDHVSVSWSNRCPTWEEMCMVKSTFFAPDEVCIEYHPAESEYVNAHPCNKASEKTREVVQMMCNEVLKVKPEFEGLLVPMCQYQGGVCHEIDGCGRCVQG